MTDTSIKQVEQKEVADTISNPIWTQNMYHSLQVDIRIGWPANNPRLDKLHHGWFRPGNSELLEALSSNDNKCIIELGSWLGASTSFILKKNSNAIVFAVDIWSNEHFLTDIHYDKNEQNFASIIRSNPIYYQFLSNMKEFKYTETTSSTGFVSGTGLIPMKMDSVEALKLLREAGVEPDFIYVDASHHYDYVVKDVETCLDLFPNAIIVGDDWDNADVKRAVKFVMSRRRIEDIYVRRNTCWTFAKAKAEAFFAEKERLERVYAEGTERLAEFRKRSFADQLETYKKKSKKELI